MPIYEFYCPDNNRIYQFYAKTLAQGSTVPKCPDNPKFRMRKLLSAFAIGSAGRGDEPPAAPGAEAPAEDSRLEAAMSAMEQEFSNVDENDPRAMGRMMRRMADLTGEKIDPEMEEVVRKLEEGADPESLEEQLGGGAEDGEEGAAGPVAAKDESRSRRLRRSRPAPSRDPKLYDYP